jgi:SMI1 / KNR4 family (SUKH-1)
MEDRLLRIKRKIAAAGKVLNPPLSEQEVLAFEHKYCITLPEGYRRFLLEVGNGGDVRHSTISSRWVTGRIANAWKMFDFGRNCLTSISRFPSPNLGVGRAAMCPRKAQENKSGTGAFSLAKTAAEWIGI